MCTKNWLTALIGALSRPRKSVRRLTDCPEMTIDAYRGRKTTTQQQQIPFLNIRLPFASLFLSSSIRAITNTTTSQPLPPSGPFLLSPSISKFLLTLKHQPIIQVSHNLLLQILTSVWPLFVLWCNLAGFEKGSFCPHSLLRRLPLQIMPGNITRKTELFKVNGHILRGKHSVIFIFALFLMGVNSYRKEFAPPGANSFL